MRFYEQKIKGVFLIEPQPFADERGMFRRHFCNKEFTDHGVVANVAQSNVSENKFKHTLRGFHYQLAPHGEGKTLSCLRGAIYDVVVALLHIWNGWRLSLMKITEKAFMCRQGVLILF